MAHSCAQLKHVLHSQISIRSTTLLFFLLEIEAVYGLAGTEAHWPKRWPRVNLAETHKALRSIQNQEDMLFVNCQSVLCTEDCTIT